MQKMTCASGNVYLLLTGSARLAERMMRDALNLAREFYSNPKLQDQLS